MLLSHYDNEMCWKCVTSKLKLYLKLECETLNTIDFIFYSAHEIIHVLNISACYQLFCQAIRLHSIKSINQSINESLNRSINLSINPSPFYCAILIHRLRLQEERELKRQQDLDYEESLQNDREKV